MAKAERVRLPRVVGSVVRVHVRYRVEMLGGLRLLQGERVITRFGTQKNAGLLAYLAYHLGQTHPREVVAELLWPWASPASSRLSLRVALTSLRRQLEPPGTPAGTVLRADRFSVQLDGRVLSTDVRDFEAALSEAHGVTTEAHRLRLLSQAADLYAGPLLPGHYEEWVLPEQERLADLYCQAVSALAVCHVARGEAERAVDCARRLVALDPLREAAHLLVMETLTAAGQPDEARRQYAELRRVLREELGEEPSAAAERAARALNDAKAASIVARRSASPEAPRQIARVREPAPAVVTLLMAEVELAKRVGGSASGKAVRACMQALCEEAGRHRGRIAREGDSVATFAFARPSDALDCAIVAQERLIARARRSPVRALSIRMALDVGEAKVREGRYEGPILEHAAALLAAAHGGQVLCSEAAAGLLRGVLGPDVELADLGHYLVRQAGVPERLFGVTCPRVGLKVTFAPRAPVAHRGSLPPRVTRFFGREGELRRVSDSVLVEDAPVTSLTGPGGSGKTRLAIEAADRLRDHFRGAVWFVPLQDVTDAGLIPSAVSSALGVPRLPDVEPWDHLVAVLSAQPSLIVLDNFEHLLAEGVPFLLSATEKVPALKCLVTSRQRLDVPGERELRLGPLPTPGEVTDPAALMAVPSVQLFVDRAQSVRPDFQVTPRNAEAAAQLCNRLEGIPLALELAAARVQALTPAQMLAHMEDRFAFLVSRRRGIPERHRTLWAAIDWSYQLLAPELQRLLARLSVFRGGWTVEAAAAVCEEPRGLEYLERLLDCSLVVGYPAADEPDEPRFGMLETLRAFARSQLSETEARMVGQRHANHYLVLAEQAESPLLGMERGPWMARLMPEQDNLRAAADWLQAAPEGAGPAMRMATALNEFWFLGGQLAEGRARLAAALGREDAKLAAVTRAKTLLVAGHSAVSCGDHEAARALFEEVAAIHEATGELQDLVSPLAGLGTVARRQGRPVEAETYMRRAIALSRETAHGNLVALLIGLGDAVSAAGDAERAAPAYAEALEVARAQGNRDDLGRALQAVGVGAAARGDPQAAFEHYREAATILRETGNLHQFAQLLEHMGEGALSLGDYGQARAYVEESLNIRRELGNDWDVVQSLQRLSGVVLRAGALDEAETLLQESLVMRRGVGDRMGEAGALEALAEIASLRNRYAEARRLMEASVQLVSGPGQERGLANALSAMGRLALRHGDLAAARGAYEQSLALRRPLGRPGPVAECLVRVAEVAAAQGDLAAAGACLREVLTEHREAMDVSDLAACFEAVAQTCAAAGNATSAARMCGAAQACREGSREPRETDAAGRREAVVTRLREALGSRRFGILRARGRKMTHDEAAALARQELPH